MPDITCPECGSHDTQAHVHTCPVLATYYPRARDCAACGHLWDEALRQSAASFRTLVFASLKKG